MTDGLHPGHPCPVCREPMVPGGLSCVCGVRIDAPLVTNEFAALGREHLHFLRIFVMFEGRIRDIESALGVSYPTVKSKIAELKSALGLDRPNDAVEDVLAMLESGEITPDEALRRLT